MAPFNPRTLTMPVAAFTMACILFVYTRTSIRLAKENARLHREEDTGQVNWSRQSARQHGQQERIVSGLTVKGGKVSYEKADGTGGGGGDGDGQDSKIVEMAREMKESGKGKG